MVEGLPLFLPPMYLLQVFTISFWLDPTINFCLMILYSIPSLLSFSLKLLQLHQLALKILIDHFTILVMNPMLVPFYLLLLLWFLRWFKANIIKSFVKDFLILLAWLFKSGNSFWIFNYWLFIHYWFIFSFNLLGHCRCC